MITRTLIDLLKVQLPPVNWTFQSPEVRGVTGACPSEMGKSKLSPSGPVMWTLLVNEASVFPP
ncbi:MAG: hypothetical protein GX428_08155 [Candidatus Atribacteria bacterium]|nr:hypothetical protein [Candidatus Atribacteria bacterium]